MSDLDARLLAAHRLGDQQALIGLYTEAANVREAECGIDAACFYLTHAFVFALHQGDPRSPDLHARLKAYGREE